MLDEETAARAAELAERILDEVSAAVQDWRLVQEHNWTTPMVG
jgi:hypothetical protein